MSDYINSVFGVLFDATRFKATLYKTGLTALSAGLLSRYVYNYQFSGNLSVFGMNIPTPVAIGLAAGLGSYVGEGLGNYVLPLISQSSGINLGTDTSMYEPIFAGVTCSGITFLTVPRDEFNVFGAGQLFILGSTANFIASWGQKYLLG
jgi:hypothetical protein